MHALSTSPSAVVATETRFALATTNALVSPSIDRLLTEEAPPLNSSQPDATPSMFATAFLAALHPPLDTAMAIAELAIRNPETHPLPLGRIIEVLLVGRPRSAAPLHGETRARCVPPERYASRNILASVDERAALDEHAHASRYEHVPEWVHLETAGAMAAVPCNRRRREGRGGSP